MEGRRGRGLLPTVLGALVGAGFVATLAGYLSGLYVDRYMPDAGLGSIAPFAIAVGIGLAVGAGLGAWVLLRVAGQPRAGLTAGLITGLTPGAAILALFATSWADVGTRDPVAPELVAIAAAITLVAAGARVLVTSRWHLRRNEPWESSSP